MVRALTGGVACSVLACLPLVVAPALAGAQEAPAPAAAEGASLRVRSVDARAYPEVSVSVGFSTPVDADRAGFAVTQGGQEVGEVQAVPVGETDRQQATVLVLDASEAMQAGSAGDFVRAAAKAYVDGRGPNERIAVISYGVGTRVLARFTTDGDQLAAAIDQVVPGERRDAAQRDALSSAAALLADEPEGSQSTVIVMAAGRDEVSTNDLASVEAALVEADAQLLAVAVEGEPLDAGPLEQLAGATGGSVFRAERAEAIPPRLGEARQVVGGHWEVRYRGPDDAEVLELVVTAAGASAEVLAPAGQVTSGPSLTPSRAATGIRDTPSFLEGPTGEALGIGLVLVAGVLLAYGVILTFKRDSNALDVALSSYTNGSLDDHDGADKGLAQTPIVQRAVELTSQLAERRGVLAKAEAMLERADLPLRAAEALFFYLAVATLVTVGGLVLLGLIPGVVVGALAYLLPPLVLSYLAGKRRKTFMSQLPDTLQLLASSLRAGYSLMQGVEAVSAQVDGPMGRELRRIVIESRLGRPLEEALDESAERMGSADFEWAVMAIRIQREVGGNLAELLLTVGETMVERERLRRDVKALTAEGRVSAIVLGILPAGLGFAMSAINPDYTKVLFEDSLGQMMLGASILLALGGFFWMKKTIEIEV